MGSIGFRVQLCLVGLDLGPIEVGLGFGPSKEWPIEVVLAL